MHIYLIDKNLPSTVPFWSNETFIHVLENFYKFIESVWDRVEDILKSSSLVIVTEEKPEGL
ncbi:hypothetical protein BH09BAC2_BH09BAC2_22820 [soil metagenome]